MRYIISPDFKILKDRRNCVGFYDDSKILIDIFDEIRNVTLILYVAVAAVSFSVNADSIETEPTKWHPELPMPPREAKPEFVFLKQDTALKIKTQTA